MGTLSEWNDIVGFGCGGFADGSTLSIQNTAQETLASVVPDVPGVFYQACASAAEV